MLETGTFDNDLLGPERSLGHGAVSAQDICGAQERSFQVKQPSMPLFEYRIKVGLRVNSWSCRTGWAKCQHLENNAGTLCSNRINVHKLVFKGLHVIVCKLLKKQAVGQIGRLREPLLPSLIFFVKV